EPSTGFFDEDLERGEIPWLDVELEHRLAPPTDDRRAAEIVAVAALTSCSGDQALEGRPLSRALEDLQTAEADHRGGESIDGAHGETLTGFVVGAVAPSRVEQLARRGRVDDTDGHLSVLLESDQRGEER